MQSARNVGDGERFARPFSLDGDQVNIFGGVINGPAIYLRLKRLEREGKVKQALFGFVVTNRN